MKRNFATYIHTHYYNKKYFSLLLISTIMSAKATKQSKLQQYGFRIQSISEYRNQNCDEKKKNNNDKKIKKQFRINKNNNNKNNNNKKIKKKFIINNNNNNNKNKNQTLTQMCSEKLNDI